MYVCICLYLCACSDTTTESLYKCVYVYWWNKSKCQIHTIGRVTWYEQIYLIKGKWINTLLDGTGVSLIPALQLWLELLLAVAAREKIRQPFKYKPQSRHYFRDLIKYTFLEILISCCIEWHQHGRLHSSGHWKHQRLQLVHSRTGITQKPYEHC